MNMSATSLKPPVSIIIIIGYIYILYTASHVQLAISLDMCIIIIGYSIYIYIASHVRLAISLDISIIIIIGYIPLVSLLSLDIYPVCRLSQPFATNQPLRILLGLSLRISGVSISKCRCSKSKGPTSSLTIRVLNQVPSYSQFPVYG